MTATTQTRKQPPQKLPPLVRYAQIELDTDNDGTPIGAESEDASAAAPATPAQRTMTFTFSSEMPVQRWFGDEILSHAPGAADLSRLNDGAPLLFNHDMDEVIGVVESARIDSATRRGVCTVRFAATEDAQEVLGMVRDGILRNVSFMYRVDSYVASPDDETYTATSWTPMEVSIVTIPADPSVGIGRADPATERPVRITRAAPQHPAQAGASAHAGTVPAPAGRTFLHPEGQNMSHPETTPTSAGAPTAAPVIDIASARNDGAATERARIAEIEALCTAHNIPAEDRQRMVRDGVSVEQARGLVLQTIQTRYTQGRNTQTVAMSENGMAPDLSRAERERYSIIRAINAVISGNWKEAGFEAEVSNTIARSVGRSTAGFYMPTNLPFAATRAADYAAGAPATGGALVATNLLAGSFIEVLRNTSRVMELGATILSGLVGNVDIPRRTSATTAYWVGEQVDVTHSAGAFDKISLSPKTVGAISQITRQMLMQGTPDIEMLVRADLVRVLALAIDLAALSGSGSAAQPRGIANQAGVGSVVGGTNGAAISIDHLIAMETSVMAANAPENGLAYLANARTVGALKTLKSTTGQYLWSASPIGQRSGTPGEINGYPVARSNQARSNLTKGTGTNLSEVFFGSWPELLIGEWGVLEIQPNPYAPSVAAQGGIELRALQSIDLGVRHAQSFAVMSDAITG